MCIFEDLRAEKLAKSTDEHDEDAVLRLFGKTPVIISSVEVIHRRFVVATTGLEQEVFYEKSITDVHPLESFAFHEMGLKLCKISSEKVNVP